jgi:hypothetical protein
MRRHKRRRIAKDCERPANLLFWERDGCCRSYEARVAADVRVSIGLTNSKRALGFEVTRKLSISFSTGIRLPNLTPLSVSPR